MKSAKVLVAMGSGMNSVVVAWLLKKQGYHLRGVYFELKADPEHRAWLQQVEKKTGIPIQVVEVNQSLDESVILPWMEAKSSGVARSLRRLFQQKIMFPRLFELKHQHQFEKVATGHWVQTQFDTVDQVTRVFQAQELEADETELTLGLNQNQIGSLEMPLGGLSKSMVEKIIQELDLPMVIPLREKPIWKDLCQMAIDRFGELAHGPYEVISTDGQNLGSQAEGFLFSLGDAWPSELELDKVDPKLRFPRVILETSEKTRRIKVIPTIQMKVVRVGLRSVSWFIPAPDPIRGIRCELVWKSQSQGWMGSFIEYTGSRARVHLDRVDGKFPEGNEAQLFPGQFVLFRIGREVVGGGEVMSCDVA